MLNRRLLIECRRALRNPRWNADAHLRAHERSVTVDQDAIARIDTCQLAANSPIEDFYSAAKCLSSNAFLLGVFDGHGGQSCSRHVSVSLFPYICASVLKKHQVQSLGLEDRLEWLFSSADAHLSNSFLSPPMHNVAECHKAFLARNDLHTVREVLQFAFETCDADICRAALPDSRGQIDRLSVMTAASGSCATLAHIRNENLHVANVGDSAAVLGVVSANGSVIARQLSRAHCIDNNDEVRRIRAAHPASETQVLRGGRLLGELYPLRAFGDVRFKWPMDLQKVVLEPLGSPAPPNLHTPPYLTVSPEVLYHKLTANDKFLVLATDGLWEWLDPDTVVRLVHDHTVGTMTLQPYQPKSGSSLRQVMLDLHERKIGEKSHKKPIDENCATHIIRHALGGVSGGQSKQYERLIDILQVPPGRARNYRDDISVIVIHFNEKYLEEAASARLTVESADVQAQQTIK
ncbi:Pyruvate dehyrogenase phosphatase catalytic subunit 1 [Trichostrongylus colubriformis]|uniref:Pyruvate dehyrogenase phosphatase catalytic subunit 1 n=1 Tax=Trichostrongylus colubriformis TaxID=6319 RepID=A0AAN8IAK2_TRICO